MPWYDAGDVRFPYSNGEKYRRNPLLPIPSPDDKEDKKPRFTFTKGVKPGLFNSTDAGKEFVFLVEGETDTMRLWQELHNADPHTKTGIVGLSGINTWTDDLVSYFEEAKKVYVVLDNDEDYMVQAQVDVAWREIRAAFGQKVSRVRLPAGVKDICEFFDYHDLETLRLCMSNVGSNTSRYKPLNLRDDPPPPNWLVEGLISKGDTTLVVGPSGIGKSWLTLGVTLAVAEGWTSFLGLPMKNVPAGGGRVLYVDQENPLDVVLTRLRQLGITERGMENIRYLWNCGVRLDRDPDKFLDEAMDFNPSLVVLDSLTRLHTQEENNAGAIAALMNNGITPLSRETGAATLLIHHDNKAGDPRGSSDIMASVDAALQARRAGEENPGSFFLKQIKSRRQLDGQHLFVSIRDDEDRVLLVADQPLNPPF